MEKVRPRMNLSASDHVIWNVGRENLVKGIGVVCLRWRMSYAESRSPEALMVFPVLVLVGTFSKMARTVFCP